MFTEFKRYDAEKRVAWQLRARLASFRIPRTRVLQERAYGHGHRTEVEQAGDH
jgi:hypothetical protein